MDDAAFLQAFERAAIPRDGWKHREHVRVAYLYTRAWPFDEALARIRAGIKALNHAQGVMDTASSGYHETLTVAWASVVADAVSRDGAATHFEAFAAAHPELLERDLLGRYYSRARLFGAEARAAFVAPDVEPLPVLARR